jgi:hypothetical protein
MEWAVIALIIIAILLMKGGLMHKDWKDDDVE